MGTRGIVGYRYRKLYFLIWVYCDCYPEGKGKEVVDGIPTEPVAFKEWLREKLQYWEEEYNKPEHLLEGERGVYYCTPSKDLPKRDCFMEWTYVIDLDRMLFTVNYTAHFRLDNIPRGKSGNKWMGSYWRCGNGNPYSFSGLLDGSTTYYKRQHEITLVHDVSEWLPLCPMRHIEVTVEIAKQFILRHFSVFSAISLLKPKHEQFRLQALMLLYALSPGLTQIYTPPKFSKHDTRWVRSELHLPNTKMFRCRGCLISLASNLEKEYHLESEIGEVLNAMNEKEISTFTAIIWASRNFAILQGKDGSVTASGPITFFDRNALYWQVSLTQGCKLMAHMLSQKSFCDGNESSPLQMLQVPPTPPVIPHDVLAMIIPRTDSDTYKAFERVSKPCRDYVIRNPRIGKYNILRILGPVDMDFDPLVMLAHAYDEDEPVEISYVAAVSMNDGAKAIFKRSEECYPVGIGLRNAPQWYLQKYIFSIDLGKAKPMLLLSSWRGEVDAERKESR